MPVGNVNLVPLLPIAGVKIGITEACVRYQNRKDLTVFAIDEGASTAVVTTQNQFAAAPVQLVREFIAQSAPRYLLINTGNANAATGQDGKDRAYATCQALAQKTGANASEILPYSTGVIGETLPSERIIAGLDDALANLQADNWLAAAHSIMTTDTTPKGHSVQVVQDGTAYTVTGISKGAGMIRPNMATMLGFVATDAKIEKTLLQEILADITNQTFNRITVDGDTSTNDCCTLIATGKVGDTLTREHPHFAAVYDAIKEVMLKIAQLIVRDGEGASKFITVKVTGGKTTDDCAKVAYAVAHSPLVKTAFFASDPNWGRILAAVGYAGVEMAQSTVNVSLDEVQICQAGGLADGYTEERGAQVMKKDEITVHIDLGQGQASDTVYTCDLSYEYVKINADYRS
ncbi:bifunctional ornithine acetyltransferase/N-acetylglutamate synthase [Moraxella caviae]|uniref:Arginine biosynthesis bifunctional protein ArgJ n=1 Tax=Moraxella caviae TaxID=34060 RepID=A0A1T0A2X3_9GAMM|nr:bifunctional glutamate N-acetyltransferase/amino-acid acetyltransferase ArgJ [Moraxella caviae]OOR90064.1 bifunctional ornithine acetyltransferase/N-acetylglutamate synthase [Moraxella caviae]STZ14671.1 Arginine biosynthesis bifunctional protein ArgJ [Moraxella caviae]